MRTKLMLCVAFAALFLGACRKKEQQQQYAMTVVKDCTGTYLRYDSKDYQVCNYKILTDYANGTALSVSYDRIDNCTEPYPPVVCQMLHANEGYILVKSIRP